MAKRAAKVVVADPQAAIKAKFIEQGSDPAIAKKALDDATGLTRGLWLSFLIFGTYLVITFAGVDHRDLLLETPVMLPVLSAPLPLVTFFWVAPILFVIFHLYLLLSLKLLADQVHHYLGAMAETGLDSDAQDRARLQLPNFVVVQVLGGTSLQLNSWAGRLMRFTAFLTLAAGPLILLLFAQLMFLPYHGWWVTMAQRLTVVLDLMFIWYFWRAITRPEREGLHVWGGVASAGVVVLAFFGLMYPGERFYGPLPKVVFQETGRNLEPFGLDVLYNTLVLRGEPLVGDELFNKLEERNKAKGLEPWQGERSIGQVLTHRDFRNADFTDIDLRKANLESSTLVGASLSGATLQGATLSGATLQGASLELASLQGALLDGASLQGAKLLIASLQGANLFEASLQGAFLDGVSLQGANLIEASLQGASLVGASLQGASLYGASLQGASLYRASLQGAWMGGAKVWRNRGRLKLTRTDLSLSLNPPGIHDDRYGLTLEGYETILAEALNGVPESQVESVREKIAILDPSTEGPADAIDWLNARNAGTLQPYFETHMIKSLIATACDARDKPYVAQGIVEHRFDFFRGDLGKQALPLVEALLAGCPGTEGMDQGTMDRLKALKEKFTSDGAAPENGEDE